LRLILRLFALAGLLSSLAVLAVVGLGGYLLVAGGAERPDCADAGSNPLDKAAKSIVFDAKLAAFMTAGASRALDSVEFDEAESAARAERYFADRTDRISDVALCFREGKATGFLRIDTALGRKLGVKAEGIVDLSGDHPMVRLTSASAGGIGAPGFLRGQVEDAINEELQGIEMAFPMALRLRDGTAEISRSP